MSDLPYGIGRYLTRIPFSWRLGNTYTQSKNDIHSYMNLSDDEKISHVIAKLNAITNYAGQNFLFYKTLYSEHGVNGKSIKYIDEFSKFPIVTKEMLRPYSDHFSGALAFNTGGTTGEPFHFFLDKGAFAREWAHMHHIWSLREYSQTDIKITLRGKNLGSKNIIYNPVHNEFIVSTYKSVALFKEEFLELFAMHDIKFVHGYPSAIYEFFKELFSITTEEERMPIEKSIRCCLLGSEFPVPYMINFLNEKWGFDYISWYGHSEMGILAYDDKKLNQYNPLMTYGYAEISQSKLLATSYNNFDMPLIRYDTGDRATGDVSENGLLKSFSIKEGREGDFILDRTGKNIPLTALVFGRHHKIFEVADFIQVGQEDSGLVTFYVTLKDIANFDVKKIEDYFELSNVDIKYTFEIMSAPIRSNIGKMKLKV